MTFACDFVMSSEVFTQHRAGNDCRELEVFRQSIFISFFSPTLHVFRRRFAWRSSKSNVVMIEDLKLTLPQRIEDVENLRAHRSLQQASFQPRMDANGSLFIRLVNRIGGPIRAQEVCQVRGRARFLRLQRS